MLVVPVSACRSGEIVPTTSGAASKDGGLETFAACDETHLYNTNKLRNMYKTVQRNLGKRKGDADPWILETSTMYKPGEESIAETSYKYAWDTASGKIKHRSGIYFDHVYANIDLDDSLTRRRFSAPCRSRMVRVRRVRTVRII